MSQLNIDESKVEAYKEKWMKIALDTTETNKEKATEYINEIYKVNGYEAPYILFVDNPLFGVRISEFAMQPESKDNLKRVLDWVATDEYKTKKASSVDFHAYGQLDAYWLIYWDYVLDNHKQEVSADDAKRITPVMKLANEVSYYWLLDKMAIVTVKPEILAIENEKPHSIFTPALKWKDLDLYVLEGKLMQKDEWDKKTAPFKSTVAQTVFQKI
jgi:hypothetical protein